MARMSNHEVVESYRLANSDSDVRWHVTKNGRVLKTTGPKGGGAKLLYTTDDGKTFRAGGVVGRRATAAEWKQNASCWSRLERVRP